MTTIVTIMTTEIRNLCGRIQLAQLLVDASIDCIMAYDTNLEVVSWNTAAEVTTGISKSDAIGKNFYQLFPDYSERREVRDAVSQALAGRKVFLPASKGSHAGYYQEQHFIPLTDGRDKIVGIQNIVHDVAHRVKAEMELNLLNKSLVRKNRDLRQINDELLSFSHVISHDLKGPLHRMRVFTEMLFRKEGEHMSADGNAIFARMRSSLQQMNKLTNDILVYAQLNKEQEQAASVDLNNILVFVRRGVENAISERKATIVSDDLPVVIGYRHMLAQLFGHIIDNSLKFCRPDAPPEIRITAEVITGANILHADALNEMEYTKITITDNGIGFDPKYSEKVFQMFYRVHEPAIYEGTGIGLTICRKIAEIHHGFIVAESEPGAGSAFHIYLPVLNDVV